MARADLYSRAVDAIAGAIKAHPATEGRIRRWPARDELIPADMQPSPRDLPALRLELAPGGGRSFGGTTEGGGVYRPATLVVRYWTDGEDGGNSIELWARLQRALEPGDLDERISLDQRLDRANIFSFRCSRPGLPEPTSLGVKVVQAVGMYDLILFDEG